MTAVTTSMLRDSSVITWRNLLNIRRIPDLLLGATVQPIMFVLLFAYVFAGSGKFCNASGPLAVPTEGVKWLDTAPPTEADNRSLIVFDSGDDVTIQAGDDGIRFLLVSGKPLGEPVAWYGPIVMNTQEQLKQAFTELEEGTFLKKS